MTESGIGLRQRRHGQTSAAAGRVTRQPGAEQPEAPPLLVLDPVIVADRVGRAGTSRLPPFLGDPLRPVGARHPVRAPPPGEAERRIVGQQPKRLDRLRRLEQPDRPRRPLSSSPRKRGSGFRATVPVPLDPRFARGRRDEARVSPTGTRTEARSGMWLSRGSMRRYAQRARAGCRAGRAAGRCRPPRSSPLGEGGARRRLICSGGNGSTANSGEDHVLDAEAGIDRLELARQEARRDGADRGSAGRCRGGSLDPAVDPVKGEVEPPRSDPLARQPRNEILRRAARSRGRRSAGSAIGSAKLSRTRRTGASPKRRQRLRQIAERLIEAARHRFAETAGERVARHRGRARRPASSPTRRRPCAVAGSSRSASTGNGASAARPSPGRQDAGLWPASRKAGQCPGGARACRRSRCGRRCAGGRAGAARSAASAASPPHRWAAAGDLDLDAVRPVGRGPRAVAAAPFGQPGQRSGILRGLGRRRWRGRAERTAHRPAACPGRGRPPPRPG